VENPVLGWYRRDPATLVAMERRRQEQVRGYESVIANAMAAGRTPVNTRKRLEEPRARPVLEMVEESLTRVKLVSGLAVTDDDVFIVVGETSGYDFSVWRLNRSLTKADRLQERLAGCCGNLDITAVEGGYAVAENSRHRVQVRDREGNRRAEFGRRARGESTDGFGGCCNPMNLAVASNGDLWTLESEGIIKRFTPGGSFAGVALSAGFNSGCYAWPFVVSADRRVAVCDRGKSRILLFPAKALADNNQPEGDRHAEPAAGGERVGGGR
jgi:hypothetical protein